MHNLDSLMIKSCSPCSAQRQNGKYHPVVNLSQQGCKQKKSQVRLERAHGHDHPT